MQFKLHKQTREQEAKRAYPVESALFHRPVVSRPRQERILRTVRQVRAAGYSGELSAVVADKIGECESAIDETLAQAAEASDRILATARVALKGGLDEINRSYRDTMDELADAA